MDKILCIIEKHIVEDLEWDEQEIWMDLKPIKTYIIKEKIIPIYNHPHSDKENGQNEIHYHIDSRYVKNTNIYDLRITLPLNQNQTLEYRMLKKIHKKEKFITPVSLIKNSKLKHKCIHKGKCPHRGYDLSNEIPNKNGIITCPLHGLQFDKITKKLLTNN